MNFANSQRGYGVVSQIFHWLIALSMMGLIALGGWMVELDYYSTWYHRAPSIHQAVGLILFGSVLLKWLWHRFSPPPPLSSTLTTVERRAAIAVHFILNVIIVLLPITGYLMATYAGKAVPIFGLFEVPAVLSKSPPLRDVAVTVHFYVAYALVAVIALHAAAAFKHRFVDKRALFNRQN